MGFSCFHFATLMEEDIQKTTLVQTINDDMMQLLKRAIDMTSRLEHSAAAYILFETRALHQEAHTGINVASNPWTAFPSLDANKIQSLIPRDKSHLLELDIALRKYTSRQLTSATTLYTNASVQRVIRMEAEEPPPPPLWSIMFGWDSEPKWAAVLRWMRDEPSWTNNAWREWYRHKRHVYMRHAQVLAGLQMSNLLASESWHVTQAYGLWMAQYYIQQPLKQLYNLATGPLQIAPPSTQATSPTLSNDDTLVPPILIKLRVHNIKNLAVLNGIIDSPMLVLLDDKKMGGNASNITSSSINNNGAPISLTTSVQRSGESPSQTAATGWIMAGANALKTAARLITPVDTLRYGWQYINRWAQTWLYLRVPTSNAAEARRRIKLLTHGDAPRWTYYPLLHRDDVSFFNKWYVYLTGQVVATAKSSPSRVQPSGPIDNKQIKNYEVVTQTLVGDLLSCAYLSCRIVQDLTDWMHRTLVRFITLPRQAHATIRIVYWIQLWTQLVPAIHLFTTALARAMYAGNYTAKAQQENAMIPSSSSSSEKKTTSGGGGRLWTGKLSSVGRGFVGDGGDKLVGEAMRRQCQHIVSIMKQHIIDLKRQSIIMDGQLSRFHAYLDKLLPFWIAFCKNL